MKRFIFLFLFLVGCAAPQEEITSRRTVILTSGGNPLVAIAAQNVSDSSGTITIDVDTLETPVTLGTGNVQLQDNSSVLEFTLDAGSNWDIVPANDEVIHNNVSAEISAITEKASPIGADLLLIEDSAASNAKRRIQITNLPSGTDDDAIHDNVSAEISAVTEKTTPVAADLLLVEDSAASNAKRRVQIGNLPAGSAEIQTTITGTTYQPTAAQSANLTVFCKTGSNTIELIDPAVDEPGNVFVYALDTNTVTVDPDSVTDGGTSGVYIYNSDTAYEWIWLLYESTADTWMVIDKSGSWTIYSGGG